MVHIHDLSIILLLLSDVQSCLLGQLTEQAQGSAPLRGKHQRHALDTVMKENTLMGFSHIF